MTGFQRKWFLRRVHSPFSLEGSSRIPLCQSLQLLPCDKWQVTSFSSYLLPTSMFITFEVEIQTSEAQRKTEEPFPAWSQACFLVALPFPQRTNPGTLHLHLIQFLGDSDTFSRRCKLYGQNQGSRNYGPGAISGSLLAFLNKIFLERSHFHSFLATFVLYQQIECLQQEIYQGLSRQSLPTSVLNITSTSEFSFHEMYRYTCRSKMVI